MSTAAVPARLAVNSAILFCLNGASAAFAFVASVLIGRALGKTGLGQYALVMAWVFTTGMLTELGLGTLITRDVAQARSEAGRYLRATFLLKIAASVVPIACLLLLAPRVSPSSAVAAGIRLACPIVLFSSLYASVTAVFRARERMAPILAITASGLALQCAGTAAILAAGRGLRDLILLAVAVQALQVGAGWLVLRPSLGAHGGIDRAFLRRMLARTAPFAVAAILGAVQLRIATILLAAFSGEAAVGRFAAASRIGEVLRLLPNAFFGALFPALAALASRRDDATGLESTFRASTAGLIAIGAIGAMAMTLLAAPILRLTYGPGFAEAAPALGWISASIAVALPGTAIELYLYARGHERFVNGTMALGLAAMLGVGIPLIARYGATGAAAATFLVEVVMIGPLYWKRRRLGHAGS